MAEEERFELSLGITPYYRLSKPAPSANLGTPPYIIYNCHPEEARSADEGS